MATITISATQTALAAENLPLSIPLKTYAVSHDSAERAEPSPPMERSQIRNRVQEGRSSKLVTSKSPNIPDSSPSTPQTLTPESIDQPKQIKESGPAASAILTTWQKLWKSLPGSRLLPRTRQEQKEYDELHGFNKLKYDIVETHPEGLPQLASFINSNDNFAVYRRFGQLSARILTQLEIDLTELEKKQYELDDKDAADTMMKHRLRGYEDIPGWTSAQRDLQSEIHKKLLEYMELLLKDSQVRALGQPPARHHLELFNYMWGEKPIAEGKDDFIFYAEDFVSAAKHTEKGARIGDFIESCLDHFPNSRLKSFLQTEKELRKTSDQYVDHYAKHRVAIVIKTISVSLAVGMLFIPVILLFLVPMSRGSMAWLVFGFVLAFSIAMATITDARVQEILIGTAAYAAVLVTLLGNMNQGGLVGH